MKKYDVVPKSDSEKMEMIERTKRIVDWINKRIDNKSVIPSNTTDVVE